MKISMAGLTIEIKNKYPTMLEYCKDFVVPDDATADFTVEVSNEEIEKESLTPDSLISSAGYLETVAIYRKIALELVNYDAFVLHCAAFCVDGEGIALLAKSGTGKTTHMTLWFNMATKERFSIVNGDKPIVRFIDGVPYAFGTPWQGKEYYGSKRSAPLNNLCFIERSKTNFIEELSPKDVIDGIFNQVIVPRDPIGAMKMLSLVDRLLKHTKIWRINCNTDIEAAHVAYKGIFGKDFE